MLALLAVCHAFAVFALWWLGMGMDHPWVIPSVLWLTLAWAWVIWPFMLALQIRKRPIPTLIALGTSVLLLAPCAPTGFAFTVWTINGFAP
jgi:hypothetical protein